MPTAGAGRAGLQTTRNYEEKQPTNQLVLLVQPLPYNSDMVL